MADEYYSSGSEDDFEEEVQAKPAPKGIGALGSFANLTKGNETKIQEEANLQGEDVTVIFKLPSGEAKKHIVLLFWQITKY